MKQADRDHAGLCSIIEANILDVVDELRAVDLVDLISFIRFDSFPTIEDLVNSSTELFFKPDVLVFSWAAAVELQWDTLPVVTLGLEFRHPTVAVFFNLTMRDAGQSVEVLGVTFDRPRFDPAGVLSRALAESRLPAAAGQALPFAAPPVGRPARRPPPWR